MIKTLLLIFLILQSFTPTARAAIERVPDPVLEDVVDDELKPERSPSSDENGMLTEDTGFAQELDGSSDAPPMEAPFNNAEQPSASETPTSSDPVTEDIAPPSVAEEPALSEDTIPVSDGPREAISRPSPDADQPIEQEDATDNPTKPHYIHHPHAKKGLLKISKKGEYFYKVKPSPQKQAGGFSIGNMSTPNIQNPDTGAKFKEVYGASSHMTALFNYEYQFFRGFGKWGFKAGSGILYAEGNGRLKLTGQVSKERFTLFMFPNNVGLIYRMQLWDKQPLIPYAEAGGDYFTFAEMRNDSKPAKYGAAPATHFAGGVAFSLNWLDTMNVSRLDQEYGINCVYLTAEYRRVVGLKSDFDLSADIISGGFLFEF